MSSDSTILKGIIKRFISVKLNKNKIMNRKILLCILLLNLTVVSESAVYNVMDFGAKNNGRDITTSQIQNAIDKCFRDGGGMVYVPQGKYLTGTINLRSNVEFHLEKGAVITASTDLKQYQKHNEHPAGVFYTEDSENVSITGQGKIFGQGIEFMYSDSAKAIRGEVNKYIRQKYDFRKVESGIGDGPLMPKERYHQMIIFSNCRNVRLSDFECVDAPYWTILIVHCDRVFVKGLSIDNNLLIPNNDGIDIVSCSNVNVSDCIITCGDDAIVLAGYAHHFGDPGFKDIMKPSQHINVSNCILQSRSSGIRIGGWDQNSMSDYNFDNITIFDSNCGINITVRDSGSVSNVTFSNIRIETRLHTGDWWGNGEPVKISAMRGVPDDRIGIIKNIFFENITCRGENAILMYASDETKLENICFTNFSFVLRKSRLDKISGGNFDLRPNIIQGKELFKSDIPVVYIENAENVYFNQGSIEWDGVEAGYYTHAIEAVKVNNLKLNNMTVSLSPSNPGLKAISLKSCSDVTDNSETVF
jgi:polygalacturonase